MFNRACRATLCLGGVFALLVFGSAALSAEQPVSSYVPHIAQTRAAPPYPLRRNVGHGAQLNTITPAARHPAADDGAPVTATPIGNLAAPIVQPALPVTRPSQADAIAFVRGLAGKALGVLNDNSLSARQRDVRLRKLMRRGLNLQLIGKFALGQYWETADSTLMGEYQKLFGDFVIATYSKHFGKRKVDAISFVGTRAAGRKDVVVSTRFELAVGIGIPANWRVRDVEGRLQIIDVEIAGISMAMTYRNEFISYMERNGGQLDGLVSRLRRRPT